MKVFVLFLSLLMLSFGGKRPELNSCTDLKDQTTKPLSNEVENFATELTDNLKQNDFYSQPENILETSEDNSWCQEQKVGETKVVNKSWFGSPSGVEMRYALTRVSEDQYEAKLNINYLPKEEHTLSPSEMRAKANHCLEKISSQYITESGKKLKIEILSPEESAALPEGKAPPKININYGTRGGDSQNHGEWMDCGTITHEVLHLMGLNDEYDPHGKDVVISGCRPVSKTQSMMTIHTDSILPNLGFHQHSRRRVCKCLEDDQACKKITKKNNELLYLYAYSNFSTLLAEKEGLNCEEISQNKENFDLDSSSKIPAPEVFSSEGHFVFKTFEYKKESSELIKKEHKCVCTKKRCQNKDFSKKDPKKFYWIETNRCPDGMDKGRIQFSPSNSSFNQGITKSDDHPHTLHFAANRGFDGLRDYQFDRIRFGSCTHRAVKYSDCSRQGTLDQTPDCQNTDPKCRVPDLWR